MQKASMPKGVGNCPVCFFWSEGRWERSHRIKVCPLCQRPKQSASLKSLWKLKWCGTGKIRLICFKYCCTLLCPCVFGESFAAKWCTGITKGVKANWLQCSKGWPRRETVTMSPLLSASLGEEMLGSRELGEHQSNYSPSPWMYLRY